MATPVRRAGPISVPTNSWRAPGPCPALQRVSVSSAEAPAFRPHTHARPKTRTAKVRGLRWPTLASIDREVLVVGCDAIETARELGKMTGWDSGKQMVLHVMEHVVGHHILEPPALRAGDSTDAIAIMVHRPHGEEGREALADDH